MVAAKATGQGVTKISIFQKSSAFYPKTDRWNPIAKNDELSKES
jgi:hypothetical protein